ncbi:MAG: LAGLIDADG family homing endonuclease [Candidatus Aenigmatarchaeota archaeon]
MHVVVMDAGYVCGVLCGAGYVLQGRNYVIGLETGDKEFAELFAGELASCVGKTPSVNVKQREKPVYVVTLYGKRQIEAFVNMWKLKTNMGGVPEATHKDHEFRIGFLSGFFDAKASVIAQQRNIVLPIWDRYISAVSTDKALLENIMALLAEAQIDSSLFRHGAKLWSIRIGGETRMKSFAKNAGFRRAVKSARLERAILPEGV